MLPEPALTHRAEDGHDMPVLVWRLPRPVLAISSAVLGGGIGPCGWLVNATVAMSYDRDDPAEHLTAMAAGLGLRGPGIGLLTGVDVADVVSASDGGVRLWATVGLGSPVQAAASPARTAASPAQAAASPSHAAASPVQAAASPAHAAASSVQAAASPAETAREVGTVNIVAWMPARLSPGALVNAVATVTEAKTQAIRDLGLDATGTATDAVCVLCPPGGPAEAYAGPRSALGAPLARAVHRAVLSRGAAARSWSDRVSGM